MNYLVILLSVLAFQSCGHKIKAPVKSQKLLKIGWSKNLDNEYVSGNLPIGLGAPRIFNQTVYMGVSSGSFHAFDLETGRELWKVQENTPLGGASEMFEDQIAYGGLNGRLFVRNATTGKLIYAIDLGDPIETAPTYFGGFLLVNLRGHQLVNLDAQTGKILWVYKRSVPITTTMQRIAKPLIYKNKVYQGFADGYLVAISLQEGSVVFENKITENAKFVDIDLNPVLLNDLIITGSPTGDLKAINPGTGSISINFGLKVSAHPVVKNQQLILGTNDGEVAILSASGEVLKKSKISKAPISALIWWKDVLIAASYDGYIRAIDPLSFKVVDEFAMGLEYSSIFSDLPHTDQEMAVYTSRNRLHLFK